MIVTNLNGGVTPVQLVDALLGPDVTIFNISFTGSNLAAGVFSGDSSIVGFEDGIVLGTGRVAELACPNNMDQSGVWSNNLPGDADLNPLVAPQQTHDATVLEFDFECANIQTIQFQYVFSSEEYNEYVNSPFNDVFAFFLNGVNIAVLPDGVTAVAINNVNCNNPYAPPSGASCNLFINNDCSDIPPDTFPCVGNRAIEMDGLTVILTATAAVSPGVNHIKLAIADTSDEVYDSNVFIRAASFTCSLPTGACCNRSDNTCSEDILEANCQGGQMEWSVGLQCTTLVPPCLPVVCGDGVVEGAEQCDPPAPYGCTSNCLLGPCGVGAQSCCVTNPAPGCQDAACCQVVCASDPFCCDTQWDVFCSGAAANLCSNICAASPPEVLADVLGNKTRFISFEVPAPATAGISPTSLRVRLFSLHHVVPPYSGGPSIPFTSFEGQVRWVGPPTLYVESSASGIPFYASSLQCNPHYQDWSTVGLLHVTGSAITPSSIYEVENVAASCTGNEDSCTAVSGPVPIATTRWGDVRTPFNPPDGSVQPDISDVSALVDKFRNAPGAPIKARAILAGEPGNTFGEITPVVLSVDFGFSHISACVDAFRGVPYPYTVASCP